MKFENSGIIAINKPTGYTSRDIVNIISKKLKTKKVGHTGTLDPLASGVLVVCVGKATKLCEMLTSEKKEYIAKVILGLNTDSLDITGNVLNEDYNYISKNDIEEVLKSFKRTYNQEVPLYSAVKVNGKKLYEYARSGEFVELPKKEVTIYDIKLLDYEYKDKVTFTFKCLVSKGTYIRSLIRDIAAHLNTYGTMCELIRTKQGNFTLDKTISLEDIENNNFDLLKVTNVLDMPKKVVGDDMKKRIINGQKLQDEGIILYLDSSNNPLAIYNKGKVLKMLYEVK